MSDTGAHARPGPRAVGRCSVSRRALRHHGVWPRGRHVGPVPRDARPLRRGHRPDPDAFRRLDADFSGKKVTGLGFDRGTLVQAGIEDAYAFAAVSDGDNSNIISARVVRETYGVANVVAR